jgi:hypothetical protein
MYAQWGAQEYGCFHKNAAGISLLQSQTLVSILADVSIPTSAKSETAYSWDGGASTERSKGTNVRARLPGMVEVRWVRDLSSIIYSPSFDYILDNKMKWNGSVLRLYSHILILLSTYSCIDMLMIYTKSTQTHEIEDPPRPREKAFESSASVGPNPFSNAYSYYCFFSSSSCVNQVWPFVVNKRKVLYPCRFIYFLILSWFSKPSPRKNI